MLHILQVVVHCVTLEPVQEPELMWWKRGFCSESVTIEQNVFTLENETDHCSVWFHACNSVSDQTEKSERPDLMRCERAFRAGARWLPVKFEDEKQG